MESGDIGSRRADCGSAVAVICVVTILLPLLPELYTVPDRTFIRDDTVTCEFCRDTMAAAVLNTVDTLSHSPVDNGSGTLRHTEWESHKRTQRRRSHVRHLVGHKFSARPFSESVTRSSSHVRRVIMMMPGNLVNARPRLEITDYWGRPLGDHGTDPSLI